MKPPWLDVLSEAAEWMTRAYPHEGCGLILDSGGRFRFRGVDNQAPEAQARNSYAIDPLEFLRAEDRAERVAVIVHSHVDLTDDFSVQDRAEALVDSGEGPRPWHPGVDYLVFSVTDRGVQSAGLFRFDAEHPRHFARIWSARL